MATYNPPTEDLTQFNSGVFNAVSGDSSLTINQGDARYLRFPIGQGAETIPSVSITGTANIGGATTMSGSASVSGTTTMSNNITLNKASGLQEMICAAPSGLKFSTTTNSAPFIFQVQSTSGVFDNIMTIQAGTNPRITMSCLELQVNSRTTGQTSTISTTSAGLTMKSTATVGAGGVILDASTSSGSGAITLATKNGVGALTTTGLILTGDTLTSATAGGSAGQHLRLTINGVQYKIALLNI